jgi:hypothetical protein
MSVCAAPVFQKSDSAGSCLDGLPRDSGFLERSSFIIGLRLGFWYCFRAAVALEAAHHRDTDAALVCRDDARLDYGAGDTLIFTSSGCLARASDE